MTHVKVECQRIYRTTSTANLTETVGNNVPPVKVKRAQLLRGLHQCTPFDWVNLEFLIYSAFYALTQNSAFLRISRMSITVSPLHACTRSMCRSLSSLFRSLKNYDEMKKA